MGNLLTAEADFYEFIESFNNLSPDEQKQFKTDHDFAFWHSVECDDPKPPIPLADLIEIEEEEFNAEMRAGLIRVRPDEVESVQDADDGAEPVSLNWDDLTPSDADALQELDEALNAPDLAKRINGLKSKLRVVVRLIQEVRDDVVLLPVEEQSAIEIEIMNALTAALSEPVPQYSHSEAEAPQDEHITVAFCDAIHVRVAFDRGKLMSLFEDLNIAHTYVIDRNDQGDNLKLAYVWEPRSVNRFGSVESRHHAINDYVLPGNVDVHEFAARPPEERAGYRIEAVAEMVRKQMHGEAMQNAQLSLREKSLASLLHFEWQVYFQMLGAVERLFLASDRMAKKGPKISPDKLREYERVQLLGFEVDELIEIEEMAGPQEMPPPFVN